MKTLRPLTKLEQQRLTRACLWQWWRMGTSFPEQRSQSPMSLYLRQFITPIKVGYEPIKGVNP